MSDERWNKIIKYFALFSAVIALFMGFVYFDARELGLWPYFVSTVQNAVHTFLFDSDISAADAYAFARSGLSLPAMMVSYLYMLVVLAAPLCSTCAVYSAVEIMLHRKWNPFQVFHREPVLILGEHESLTAAITNEDSKKYHFYLATKGGIGNEEDELELLRKQTVIVALNDYDDYDNNMEILSAQIRLKKLRRIIIARKTMADTLTLYMWICQLAQKGKLSKDIKVYALCNGFGGERVMEQIYENGLKKADMPELITYDSFEISARKILSEHIPASKDGTVHAVITGFTPLAQQLTANLMNMAVVSANGKITIDIIDAKVDDGRKTFARRFSPDYFQMDEKEWILKGEKADGELLIRFHKVDPNERSYIDLLSKLYKEEPFTYSAICLSNADSALSSMLEIEQIIKQNGGDTQIPIGIRIDENDMLANNIENSRENLFTFDERSGNVTMDDIFYETIDAKAKIYNYIYNAIQFVDESAESDADDEIKLVDAAEKIDDAWRKMLSFQQSSSRMLADHASVKMALTDPDLLDASIGPKGTVMMQKNHSWVMYGNDDDFLKRLAEEPDLEELAKLEHRRWCYAMAVSGWSYAPGKKDAVRKTSPCLVSWEELKKTRPDMCKYDLMPYMYMKMAKDE